MSNLELKVGFIPVGGDPRIETIKGEIDEERRLSFREAINHLLKTDSIDHFDCLYGYEPVLVTDEHAPLHKNANRSILANERMVKEGYRSHFDSAYTVEEGELYLVLYGDIVAVCYDEFEQAPRDITEEEFEQLKKDFINPALGRQGEISIACHNRLFSGHFGIHKEISMSDFCDPKNKEANNG